MLKFLVQIYHYPPPSNTIAPNPINMPNTTPYQQSRPYQAPPPPIDLPLLHRDIADLVRNAHSEANNDANNPKVQERLQALLSLQTLLRQQYHPPEQLQRVRDQVSDMQSQYRQPFSASGFALPNRDSALPLPIPSSLPSVVQAPLNPRVSSPLDIQALMSSRHLASIIASAQKAPAASSMSQIAGTQIQTNPANGTSDLIASLTKAGLLNGPPASVSPSSNVGTPSASHPALAHLVPQNDVQLTPGSLRR